MRTRGLLLSLGLTVAIALESTVVRAQGGAPSHEKLARAAVQRVLGRGAPETVQVYGEIAPKTSRIETQSPSLQRPGRPWTTVSCPPPLPPASLFLLTHRKRPM
eukprot:COSAG01_NODE_851_length_13121_cov_49.974044_2_plen_104_part_00